MKKIIFLDIDGVVSSSETYYRLTPRCQDLLKDILIRTGAKIVLSSSWRKWDVDSTVEYMREEGFDFCEDIIGVTIRGYQHIEKGFPMSIPRGVEIKHWIDNYIHRENAQGSFNRKVLGVDYNYVILDDDTDMLLEQLCHFVHTDPLIGLTRETADKAIEILNKEG